jgi:hypothetical protein
MRRILIAGLTALALSASTAAAGDRDSSPPPVEGYFAGIVQERDVALVFDYLRDALSAAVEGREPPPADQLVQRAEVIGEEVKRRGAAAARSILDAIEESVREGMREPRRPPIVRPQQPI